MSIMIWKAYESLCIVMFDILDFRILCNMLVGIWDNLPDVFSYFCMPFRNSIKYRIGWVLADHWAKVITTLISLDQTGFIPPRQITDNIHLAFNIVEDANLSLLQVMMLSHSIAFSGPTWELPYPNLVSGVNLCMVLRFYIPILALWCNSEYFELWRKTQQGCPLSPLLFTLAIEPLERSIILNQDIKRYVKGDQH